MLRGYETVERFFVDDNAYIAGPDITLADFSIWSTLLVLDQLIPIEAEKFPKLKGYLKMLESHKSYQMNLEGAQCQADYIAKCMAIAKNYKISSFELTYPKLY